MSEWFKESEASLQYIHQGMKDILLNLQSNDELSSKVVVDKYIEQVCRLKELLMQKVGEMSKWEESGFHAVERATLERLEK